MDTVPSSDSVDAVRACPPLGEGRSPTAIVIAIVTAAIALRVAYALPRHACFADESFYLMLAKNLFSGEGYTYYNRAPELHFPPLFPIVLGLLNLVVRNWEVVSLVAYVIFGGLLPIPVYLLGRAMYGLRPGLLAAGLTAILPAFTSGILFAETMAEPLWLLLLFWGLYYGYRMLTQRRLSSSILTGAFLSLAYLVRPEAMVHFFLIFAAFMAVLAIRRPLPAPKAIGRLGVLLSAFLLVASPYVIYLHRHLGRWTLTTKSVTSYVTTRPLVDGDRVAFHKLNSGLNADGEMVMYAQDFRRGLLELLLGPYRHRVLSDVRKNARSAWNHLLAERVWGRVLLLFCVLGLIGSPWSSRRLRSEVFNGIVLLAVSPVLLFFIADRFLYPALLPFILWSAQGLEHVLSWIERTHAPFPLSSQPFRAAAKAIALLAVVTVLLCRGRQYFERTYPVKTPIWENVRWLKDNTPPDAVVMNNGPEVVFHAGRRWLPLPVASVEEIVAFGRKRGATHLSMLRRYSLSRPDQMRDLFDDPRDREGLELLAKVVCSDSEASFVVYRIVSAESGLVLDR